MMPDFVVRPSAVRFEAGNKADRARVIARMSQQIQQARATEDCFGMIGRYTGFFLGYEELVGTAEQHVKDAAEFLHSVADRLTASANQYEAVEALHRNVFRNHRMEVGTGTSQAARSGAEDEAADIADDIDDVQEAVRNFQHATSLPEMFVAGAGVKREVDELLSHPMQSFVSYGLGFLVDWCMRPLRPVFAQVMGDPDEMRSAAAGWRRMSGFLKQAADQDASEQQALAHHWHGPASAAYRRRMKEFQQGLRALADCGRQLGEHLEQVADFFERLWQTLVDIVRKFVDNLVVTWLSALATSTFSAGSSIASAWATSATRISTTVSRLLTQVSKAVQWLSKALDTIEQISKAVQELMEMQKTWVRPVRRSARAMTV